MWHEFIHVYVNIYSVLLMVYFIVSILHLFKYLVLLKINLAPLWDACMCLAAVLHCFS